MLGPLTMLQSGRPVQLPAEQPRTVLALLVVETDQAVPAHRLVDEMWGGTPPATARKTVQGYVWRLRRALGPQAARLETTTAGYRLRLRLPGECDWATFDAAVALARRQLAAGDTGAAADRLAGTLALWRGPAFAGLRSTPTLAAEGSRLEEARLSAIELHLAARFVRGESAGLVPELTALVGRHPFREPQHRLLMAALHAAGRRPEALAVYNRLRLSLAGEYGTSPAGATEAVYLAIMRDTSPAPLLLAAAEDGLDRYSPPPPRAAGPARAPRSCVTASSRSAPA